MEPDKWSVYLQGPEYLELTRMFMIPRDMYPLVRRWCGLADGMNVLDVGTGTGYFSRLLAAGGEKVTVTGLDRDDLFIAYARKKAGELGLSIDYVLGDALVLPFGDRSFDLVASFTFLTAVSDPGKALAEMKRVVRPGGIIASVTPISFDEVIWEPGQYPEDCACAAAYYELYGQFYEACHAVRPFESMTRGISPLLVPRLFADAGLESISTYPLGKVVSLSNAAIPEKEKRLYVDLYQAAEEKKLEAYMALPEMESHFTPVQAAEYLRLLREICDWRREHLNENTVWNWHGNTNLLVTGIRR